LATPQHLEKSSFIIENMMMGVNLKT